MAAIELGIPYYVYNPAQTDYFALNVPGDANFAGYVSDVTGLDDAEVRENAQNVNAGDGGFHGRFWRGRRPWTVSGFVMPVTPVIARSAAVEHMEGIMAQCLAQDGFLMWTQASGITKYIPFRKQQPLRDTKGQSNVQRNFLLAGVCADYRIYGWSQHNINANAAGAGVNQATSLPNAHNSGNADAPFTFVLTGPSTSGVVITNWTTNKQISVASPVAAGQQLVIDLTGRYPTVINNGVDVYGSVAIFDTDWSAAVASGDNVFTYTTSGAAGGTNGQLLWRDAWA